MAESSLYIHGFGSSGRSYKGQVLKRHFEREGVPEMVEEEEKPFVRALRGADGGHTPVHRRSIWRNPGLCRHRCRPLIWAAKRALRTLRDYKTVMETRRSRTTMSYRIAVVTFLLVTGAQTLSAAPENIRIVKGESPHASVATASIQATVSGLLVSGWVKRRYPTHRRLRGNVEVLLLDADNQVLERHVAMLSTHDRPAQHQRQVGFSLTLSRLPEGLHTIYLLPTTTGPAL